MPSPVEHLLSLLLDRVDTDLLPAIYAAASLSTAEIRAQFEEDGLPFLNPLTGRSPPMEDVILASAQVIRHSRNRATALGGLAGISGPISVPPEVLANLVQILRLSQRLAVLFGFDPETDAGRLVMVRALAAAYGLAVPAQGQLGLRLRDLPMVLRSQLPEVAQPAWLLQQAAHRTRGMIVRRVVQAIPGLGLGVSAWSALRRVERAGQEMVEVYRRACQALPFDIEDEVLAIEIRRETR